MREKTNLTLNKSHILNSMLGKTVKAHHETPDVTMQVQGKLGFDEEFGCYIVNLRSNGVNVARFGVENLVKVDLVERVLQLESFLSFDS